MKSKKSSPSNAERAESRIPEHAEAGFLIGFIILALLTLVMASCNNDDDVKSPDTAGQFIGTYTVEDISSKSGYVYEYEVTVSKGGANELKFSNFADMFNVPIKATVHGNLFDIPRQSFKNPSSGNTIEVYGSGSIENGILKFSYTTEGYLDYTGTCTANKK